MAASDIALEKGLPSNIDAERFVLGAILLDDTYFIQAAGTLDVDDFSLEKHRRIFQRMGDLADRGERIDRVTVANELMKLGELESVRRPQLPGLARRRAAADLPTSTATSASSRTRPSCDASSSRRRT